MCISSSFIDTVSIVIKSSATYMNPPKLGQMCDGTDESVMMSICATRIIKVLLPICCKQIEHYSHRIIIHFLNITMKSVKIDAHQPYECRIMMIPAMPL